MSTCNCINEVNKMMEERNTKLVTGMTLIQGGKFFVLVGTEKADKANRKKPSAILPSFCCFCGASLKEEA